MSALKGVIDEELRTTDLKLTPSTSLTRLVDEEIRASNLRIVAVLLERIDAPNVTDDEGTMLARDLHMYSARAKADALFDTALKKPHFRRWWTAVNAQHLERRVVDAIALDSSSAVANALDDLGAITDAKRTHLAVECLKKHKYTAWLAVTQNGTKPLNCMANDCEYVRFGLGAQVPTTLFKNTLARLVETVLAKKLEREVASKLIYTCLDAVHAANSKDKTQPCYEALSKLIVTPVASSSASASDNDADDDETEDDDDDDDEEEEEEIVPKKRRRTPVKSYSTASSLSMTTTRTSKPRAKKVAKAEDEDESDDDDEKPRLSDRAVKIRSLFKFDRTKVMTTKNVCALLCAHDTKLFSSVDTVRKNLPELMTAAFGKDVIDRASQPHGYGYHVVRVSTK